MRAKGLAVFLLAAACGGCVGRLETSLEVAEVEANREAFAQVVDHPLLSVPAGTVIDDLSGMEGCWGAYVSDEYMQQLSAGGGLAEELGAVDTYFFYRFDLERGELTFQGLMRMEAPFVGAFDFAEENIYSLEITAPDTITVQLQSRLIESNVDSPGNGLTEFAPGEVELFDVQVILEGEVLRIFESEGRSLPSPHEIVFFRFDCPK